MSTHRAYQMYAHITWHTWNRCGCLDRLAAIDVTSALTTAGRDTGVRVLRAAVLSDHVHVVASFRPDTRLSDFVRHAKSLSATRANRRVAGTVRWARGYYVATLHRHDLNRVLNYVAGQFRRHPDRVPRDRVVPCSHKTTFRSAGTNRPRASARGVRGENLATESEVAPLQGMRTVTSVWSGASGTTCSRPPGHRTQSAVGSAARPSTCTAPFCDQYPEPACTSRTGPSRSA